MDYLHIYLLILFINLYKIEKTPMEGPSSLSPASEPLSDISDAKNDIIESTWYQEHLWEWEMNKRAQLVAPVKWLASCSGFKAA